MPAEEWYFLREQNALTRCDFNNIKLFSLEINLGIKSKGTL